MSEGGTGEQKRADEFEGSRVIGGELKATKGDQLVVDGIILIIDDAKMKKSLREKYFRKQIKLRGDMYVYYCDPDEQCPEEGYFKYMKNVEVVDG